MVRMGWKLCPTHTASQSGSGALTMTSQTSSTRADLSRHRSKLGQVRVLVLRRDPGAPTAGVDSAAMGNTAAV